MTFNISKLGLVRKNQLINANFKKIYHCTRSPSNGLLIVLCKLTFCFCTISGFIRLDATLRREKNLCEQPFAFLMTIKTNVKCNNVLLFCRSIRLNDHHQQQKQHQKKKTNQKNTFNKHNNFARAPHIFCTFLGRFARRDYVVETPNFAFWESLDNQRRNLFF